MPELTQTQINALNNMCPAAGGVGLGNIILQLQQNENGGGGAGGDDMSKLFGDGTAGEYAFPGGDTVMTHLRNYSDLSIPAGARVFPFRSLILGSEKVTIEGEINAQGNAAIAGNPIGGFPFPTAGVPVTDEPTGILPFDQSKQQGVNSEESPFGAVNGRGIQYRHWSQDDMGYTIGIPPVPVDENTPQMYGNGGFGGAVGPNMVAYGAPNFYGFVSEIFKGREPAGEILDPAIDFLFNEVLTFFTEPNGAFYDLYAGGLGGGSGDVSGPGASPGAGGGGGGLIVVFAKEIELAASAVIDIRGGDGADATPTGNIAGGGGGGGGGGILMVCRTLIDNGATFLVDGGLGGDGADGGGPGSPGQQGWKHIVEIPAA